MPLDKVLVLKIQLSKRLLRLEVQLTAGFVRFVHEHGTHPF